MKDFNVDLHIHTVLSPCGDLDMSPDIILARAKAKNLDLIGITDHNSTRQCRVIRGMGAELGIGVLAGAEVTTREEIHCLVFFDSDESLDRFQLFLDERLPAQKNDPDKFGYQVIVDSQNNVTGMEERLLLNALNAGLEEVEQEVHRLGGIFIPAHIDKSRFSILSQLGFLPSDLAFDALEISPLTTYQDWLTLHPEHRQYCFISSSDAHLPDQIGRRFTRFTLLEPSFCEIRKALKKEEGRNVLIMN